MSATRTWLLIGVVLAAGVGVARMLDPGRPKVVAGTRVYLFGDSLAQGLGPPLGADAASATVEFHHRGVRSTRIASWTQGELLQALRADLERYEPDLVLVSLGTNDAALSEEQQRLVPAALDDLLEELERHRIVWILPPSWVRDGKDRSAYVRDLIRARVPVAFPSQELDIPRGPDGLHPTVQGYAGWAAAIWEWLS